MTTGSVVTGISQFIKKSATVKVAAIGILILLLQIPATMIDSVIRERESRKDNVIQEIGNKWGREQIVGGPVLSVPYKYLNVTKKEYSGTCYAHFLPKKLSIQGTLNPQIRYRGIYKAPLYDVILEISGEFEKPDIDHFNLNQDNSVVMWDNTTLSLGISDMSGIREQITGKAGEEELKIVPGIASRDVFTAGVSAALHLPDEAETIPFRFLVHLNGSKSLQFLPFGETTTVSLKSAYPHPSFSGNFLPVERTVTKDGFSAQWQVFHLNRNYPQSFLGERSNLESSAFGVELFEATDLYSKTDRTIKYAIMFLVFTFTAFFIAEIINNARVHPLQYLLIGFAVTMFYVLQLSLSEHIGFNPAFLCSGLAVIVLVGGYTKAILGMVMSMAVSGLLLFLYGYLFITLQLEDYALLVGSIGLFNLLATVMYLTRKVDWYSLGGNEPVEAE